MRIAVLGGQVWVRTHLWVNTAHLQHLIFEGAPAEAIRARTPINIADAQTDPRRPEAARSRARTRGFRSVVAVPLLRHQEAIGAISVSRREAGGFTDDEIALLQTFADQAVCMAFERASPLEASLALVRISLSWQGKQQPTWTRF